MQTKFNFPQQPGFMSWTCWPQAALTGRLEHLEIEAFSLLEKVDPFWGILSPRTEIFKTGSCEGFSCHFLQEEGRERRD